MSLLIVREGDQFRTVQLDYRGGLRYPHLERDPARPALLAAFWHVGPEVRLGATAQYQHVLQHPPKWIGYSGLDESCGTSGC
jgi:hypothetical protein